MKIYIMTDMEGISGIYRQEQVMADSPHYGPARRLLGADINAAIAGAFDGGATEVLVCDGHSSGFNFILEEMDERAVYERPNSGLDYMPGLDETFDGVFCVGYHAMAGTINGFLDHTQSSKSWFNFYLNGRRTGELGQVGAWVGVYDIPVVFVTGDQAACDEAREFFGDIETVAVKQGIGRQFARCIHPVKARENIREAAARAMSRIGSTPPYKITLPLTVRLEYYRSDMADIVSKKLGVRRLDARTIEWTVDEVHHMMKAL